MSRIFKFFKNLITFIIILGRQFLNNELYFIASELTYKLLLAIFPFGICIVSIVNLINIDINSILSLLDTGTVPDEVKNGLSLIFANIHYDTSNAINAIIFSLVFAIFSASSGFVAIIRGINKSYATVDERNFIVRRILSVLLVIGFLLSLVLSFVLLIFGDIIMNFISLINIFPALENSIYTTLSVVFTITFLLINIMSIYKFSSYKRIPFSSTFPGAIVTLIFWVIASKLFNIYVNNFSNYNALYGSIGSVLIFIIWLNIIAIVLLLGSQINAILLKAKTENRPLFFN